MNMQLNLIKKSELTKNASKYSYNFVF